MDTRLKYQLKPSTLDAAGMSNDGRTGWGPLTNLGNKFAVVATAAKPRPKWRSLMHRYIIAL